MSSWTSEERAAMRERLKQLPPEKLQKIVEDKAEDAIVRIMAQTALLVHDPKPPPVTE